ncbi:hypothetical protein MWU75_16520 [Ornithinimicrobium sp. F0845]|uniref:hypothetical protein n=1 Tax=Ornithinimicrobium sp. F0845 TaxID=2926412 RepID=UPI001FF24580|nr:hypothetical protein [Ornithinimicrobium sp. F0845]MCK0113752.1 hypothetical protein [Ornithinimicrobium sp. F0845]
MADLPASVRVALWGTAALAGRLELEAVARRAMPDLDHVDGLVAQLALWRDLGERLILVALPRAGDLTSMPRGPADLIAAATESEELVYVTGLGGALVPRIAPFGPEGDQGWEARWTAHDADPVPQHVVQQLSLPDVELQLRREVAELTAELGQAPGQPLSGHGLEAAARDSVDAQWGLPEGLPPRAIRVIELAGAITGLAGTGLDHRLHSVSSSTTLGREQILRRLHDAGSRALVAATNVGALHLAGWR